MRGKYWIKALPNGSMERESNPSEWLAQFPGTYSGLRSSVGGMDYNLVYNGAIVAGNRVAWYIRPDKAAQNLTTATKNDIYRNYEFSKEGVGVAEEYCKGSFQSPKLDANGVRHMAYQLDGKVMVWSQPGYNSFVIIDCTLKSQEDVDTLKDFYYARLVRPSGPSGPSGYPASWDKEYEWDATIGDSLGFIFYDGTSIPPNSAAPVYTISPGDVTGDAGDPGNIAIQGSRDYKLYSPYVYAYTFDLKSLTANKYNQKRIWRKVLSVTSSATDSYEKMYDRFNDMEYDHLVSIVSDSIRFPQPPISWAAAYDSIQRGYQVSGAGSKWERDPLYVYGIGPYDIPPGGTIRWKEVFIAGQMDRNVSMKGGIEATSRYRKEGIADLVQNWHNAAWLMSNGYTLRNANRGAIPPPTPCTTPRTMDADSSELKATPWAIFKKNAGSADSTRLGGIQLAWRAVHVGYQDPYPGIVRKDFAAYKVYRSDNSFEGPWTLIDSIPIARADSLVVPNDLTISKYPLVKYFVQTSPNVPYRYCVTSIDTGRNESAMTGYTYYPVAAEPDPTNKQSQVRVVPNPFRQVSGYPDQAEEKRLAFVNIPSYCTIRIYTLALDLLKTLEHRSGGGIETWGSQAGKDYMLTDFAQNVQPGIYIYHIESHVPGHEGETSVGKLAIIK